MNSNIHGISRRIERVSLKLNPPVKDTRLPFVYTSLPSWDAYCQAVKTRDYSTMIDYPGYEQHNAEMIRLAKRRGIIPEVYCSDPETGPWWEQEGTEP
jgi:hypothetical protein